MKQYLDLCRQVLEEGIFKENRTGVRTIGIHGAMMKFDLRAGFPAVTTKQLYWNQCFAEMLGFLRGYDNAADFRALGCNVWDMNANKNKQWLANRNRKGEDDLGSIYGVQARSWPRHGGMGPGVDQLKMVVGDLSKGIDNRREIVTHWNPSELDKMALPPCHLLYQFGLQGDVLNLSMYQRSCDMPLGVPFNIAGYAWLLSVIARITGHTPGVFTHFLHDVHVYEDQIDLLKTQIERAPLALPTLHISDRVTSLNYLDKYATLDDFYLLEYTHEPAIKYPFAV